MARGLGIGASLASIGQGQQREAMQTLGEVANQESQRNITNQQIEQQEQAGKQQLGGTLGSLAGMAVGGPLGAMVGGALGSIAGGLF